MLKSIIFSLRWAWQIDKRRVLYELFYNVLKQFFNVFYGVYFLRALLNAIETGQDFSQILMLLSFMLLVSILFYYANNHFREVYLPRFDLRFRQSVYESIVTRASHLPYDSYNEPEFLDRYKRVVDKTADSVRKTLTSLGTMAGLVVALGMIAVYIIPTDPFALLLSLLPLGYSYFLSDKSENLQFELDKATTISARKKEYADRIFYLPCFAKELRLTRIANALQGLYDEGTEETVAAYRQNGPKIARLKAVEACVGDVFIIMLPIAYVAVRVLTGARLQIGDFVGIAQSIAYFGWDVEWFFDMIVDIKSASLRIREYKEYTADCDKAVEGFIIPDGRLPDVTSDFILSCRNAAYAYPGSEAGVFALHGIDFDIRKGEKIAIVGENGAGKTTLVSLLMHLLSCTEGKITLGGRDLESFAPGQLSEFFGVVLQDFHLYPISVRENVDPDGVLDDKTIWSALRDMALDGVIHSLDTQLTREFSDDGLELSGGQLQRLALARVVARGYPFVILDEPTSALDPITEREIYRLLAHALADRTLLFISHRLASTRFVDRIIVVRNGTIEESGSHVELMAAKGYYYSLYTLQESLYKEAGR